MKRFLVLFLLTTNQSYGQEYVTNISDQGLDFIKQQEAYIPKPYFDHTGYAIGYGNQKLCNGKKVTAKTKPITEQEATKHLKCLIDSKNDVLIAFYIDNKMEINQDMHDALLSFTYNIGSYGVLRSSVIKHLINKNCIAAKNSLLSYNKASGITLKGLINRRNKEAEMLFNGCKQINESIGYDYYKVTEKKRKKKIV